MLSDYYKNNNFEKFAKQFEPIISRSRPGDISFKSLNDGRIYRDVMVGGSGDVHHIENEIVPVPAADELHGNLFNNKIEIADIAQLRTPNY